MKAPLAAVLCRRRPSVGAALTLLLLLPIVATLTSGAHGFVGVASGRAPFFRAISSAGPSLAAAAAPDGVLGGDGGGVVDYDGTDPRPPSRRIFFERAAASASACAAAASLRPEKAAAAGAGRSRTAGYEVQKSDGEWRSILSANQYEILRLGGTERPYSSILEGEDRSGTFYCAGCNTPLFESSAKFHSGTGWPSFASGLKGVEVDKVNPIQMNLAGAELRCKICGGHLGDVFNDGMLFVGTPAAKTGKRFCIDGYALVFRPEGGGEEVRGDSPPSSPVNPLFAG